MRLALLADIHGNLPALEAVLEALKMDAPDGILVAGDWISGPFINEIFQVLQDHIKTSILGNSDIRLLEYIDGNTPTNWSGLKQFAMLRWDAQHLEQTNLALLRSMPEQRVVSLDGTAPIRIVHGSLDDPFESLFNDRNSERLDRTFARLQESVLVCGHTHRPMVVERNGKLIINPGSIAAPLNGDTHAQFAMLTWKGDRWQGQLKRVAYDHQRIMRAFEDSGYLAECGALARAFLETILIGEDIAHELFQHARQLGKNRGIDITHEFPDALWEEAGQTFDWKAVEKRRHD